MVRGLRALTCVLVLPGCGVLVGLRSDYELGDASVEAGAGDAASDGKDASRDANKACDAADPTCCDNMKDGKETDVDCGGGVCPRCGNGQTCKQDNDCTSNNCLQQGNKLICKP